MIFSEKRDSDTRNVEALVEGLGENMHTFGLEEDPLSAKDLNARDIGSGGRVSLLKGHSPQKHVEEESFGDKRDDDSFPFQVKREAMDPTESFFDFEGENYITNDDYLKVRRLLDSNSLIIYSRQESSRRMHFQTEHPLALVHCHSQWRGILKLGRFNQI